MEIMEKFEMEVRKLFSHVSFHPLEIKLYSHDISVIPGYLEKMVSSDAEVIIQPESVDDVREILRISGEYSKPIVPRGSATSGYGGVVPLKGGIVVDFSRMNHFEIDEETKTVKSEPGAIWWDIQKEARKKNLSLRIYPTSALSSTVGGWIAQGGLGIGSTMFGGIGENIEEIEVLDFERDKRVKKVRHDNLKYYIGMEGTTGLITSSAIKLMDYKEEIPVAADVKGVMEAVKIVERTKPYSAILMSSEFFRMMNEVKGTDFEEKDILLAVYLEKAGLDGRDAYDLWNDRFYPLRIKKKGPSLVSIESLIPFENLGSYYREIKKEVAADHAVQTYFSKKEANVIVLIPSDERDKRFMKDWKTAFKLLKVGMKLGGRPYATGLYLSYLSRRIILDYDELLKFKKKVDPANLLNPGKIFPEGRVPMLMKIAGLVI
jgi:FAD/FMN-containing dehydrogenase